MSEPERPSISALIKGAIIACFVVWAGYVTCVPDFTRSGPSKTNGVMNNLRRLDAAKQIWALEHGQTNAAAVPTMEDLAPYLRGPRDGEGLDATTGIKPVAGERYFIKSLAESPEAELMRELDGRPKGTVFRMATNVADEIVLPKESH